MNVGGVVRSLFDNILIYESDDDALDDIQKVRSQAKGALIVSFVNAHAVNLAIREPSFHSDLCRADFLLRDGVGVSLLYRAASMSAGANLNGTDFIPVLLSSSVRLRVAVWGTKEPNLGLSVERIQSLGHSVVSVLDGFHDAERYVSEFAKIDADIVMLGMGMPKQEMLSVLLKEVLPVRDGCLIICGGAVLDFLSGNIARAPDIYIKLKLEWLYRMVQEPRRLWRRYLLGNILFLYRVLLIWLGARLEK
jgi:exopolysaccharide biosynthesis WecB/TagA/CpsF family protein